MKRGTILSAIMHILIFVLLVVGIPTLVFDSDEELDLEDEEVVVEVVDEAVPETPELEQDKETPELKKVEETSQPEEIEGEPPEKPEPAEQDDPQETLKPIEPEKPVETVAAEEKAPGGEAKSTGGTATSERVISVDLTELTEIEDADEFGTATEIRDEEADLAKEQSASREDSSKLTLIPPEPESVEPPPLDGGDAERPTQTEEPSPDPLAEIEPKSNPENEDRIKLSDIIASLEGKLDGAQEEYLVDETVIIESAEDKEIPTAQPPSPEGVRDDPEIEPEKEHNPIRNDTVTDDSSQIDSFDLYALPDLSDSLKGAVEGPIDPLARPESFDTAQDEQSEPLPSPVVADVLPTEEGSPFAQPDSFDIAPDEQSEPMPSPAVAPVLPTEEASPFAQPDSFDIAPDEQIEPLPSPAVADILPTEIGPAFTDPTTPFSPGPTGAIDEGQIDDPTTPFAPEVSEPIPNLSLADFGGDPTAAEGAGIETGVLDGALGTPDLGAAASADVPLEEILGDIDEIVAALIPQTLPKNLDELGEQIDQVLGESLPSFDLPQIDSEELIETYRISAVGGFVEDQYIMGEAYFRGAVVEQDLAQAAGWHGQAAEKKLVDAQLRYGQIYAIGQGVETDLTQAHLWWSLAADAGETLAKRGLKLIEGQMTPEQIFESEKQQIQWQHIWSNWQRFAKLNIPEIDSELIAAARSGEIDVVKMLLDQGADVNAPDEQGRTALLWSVINSNGNVASALLGRGADPNVADQNGKSALMWAADNGDETTVKALLKKDIDVNARDAYGETALINAAWSGRTRIVEILLAKGAIIGMQDEFGSTAMLWAAINGHVHVTEMLTRRGAELDDQDAEGLTALMRAAWNNRPKVVEFLLANGADPTITDEKGRTALELAESQDNEAILAVLRAAGVAPD